MTDVEVFVDPSCPWAWITSRWVKDVAPHRDLAVTWRSFCLEIRDDYGVAPTMPEERREAAIAAHAVSHRMLRIFEAARAAVGEEAVDALLTEWGRRFFVRGTARGGEGVADRDRLVAAHEGGLRGLGLAGQLEGLESRHQLAEQRSELHAASWAPRQKWMP